MIRELRVSEDFNQMLVTSVFIHFLLLASLLFIPKPQLEPKVVIPAFMVDLAEIPGGPEEGVGEPAPEVSAPAETAAIQPEPAPIQPAPVKPVPVKEAVPERPTPKRVAQSKPVPAKPEPAPPPPPVKKEVRQPDASALLMKELESIDGKPKPKPILEELDLLAKATVPKKVAPSKMAAGSARQTVRELEALKQKVIAEKPKAVAKKEPIREDTVREESLAPKKREPAKPSDLPEIKVPENLLEGLEDLKIKEEVKTPAEASQPETPESAPAEPLEYARLEEVREPEQASRLGSDFESLLKDLESLDRPAKPSPTVEKPEPAPLAEPAPVPAMKPETAEPTARVPGPATTKPKPGDAFADIKKKLPRPEEHKAVEIEIGSPAAVALKQEFVSKVRTARAKKPSGEKDVGAKPPGAAGRKGGSPDPLALYVGRIKKIIDSHWKIPLGVEHKKEIVASFFLYSGGNIDKPQMKTSSGVEQLDSMAIKAILDSAPFPKFPEELRESLEKPNLHITMHFKLTTGQ